MRKACLFRPVKSRGQVACAFGGVAMIVESGVGQPVQLLGIRALRTQAQQGLCSCAIELRARIIFKICVYKRPSGPPTTVPPTTLPPTTLPPTKRGRRHSDRRQRVFAPTA